MKTFLLATLILSSVFADYKNTESLYHDTSKSVHQSISLHNVKAEPAEVITRTEIRRVPKYEYYNVYKTRTVWKCLPNGGGGPIVVGNSISWTATSARTLHWSSFLVAHNGGNAYSKGWQTYIFNKRIGDNTYAIGMVCHPDGTCKEINFRVPTPSLTGTVNLSGTAVEWRLQSGGGFAFSIHAGSYIP